MKAAIFRQYGLPGVLHIEEIATPVPADNEVLVKIIAASVNDWDWGLLRGIPFANRSMAGVFKPSKIMTPGCDIAGQVEVVGKKVKQFKPGDEVFGDISGCGFGGFAEYVCATENALNLKPREMSFEQAAALPQAGVLAFQGLVTKGKIKPGQKVLINGASGGAGSFAVQIAKAFATEVTAVCSAKKSDFVRSLGADHVIDYSRQDFTASGQRYDLILDLMSFHSLFACRRALSRNGRYVIVGGATSRIMQTIFIGTLFSLLSKKKTQLLLLRPNKDIAALLELYAAGKICPAIDKVYPLSGVPDAMRYFGEGDKKGKVIISMK